MTDTYTMLYDSLVAELGLLRAAVLCAVLRYCRMSDGVCRASLRTIAARLHLSQGSVHKALKQLVADGYLQDLTPTARYVPHRYRDTGKLPAPRHDRPASAAAGADPAAQGVNTTVHDVNPTAHAANASVHAVQEKRVLRDTEETREDTPSAPPTPPEIVIVRQTCGHAPPPHLVAAAVWAVRQVGQRLGRTPTPADLVPYWARWVGRGYKPSNHAWLFDWAARDERRTFPTRRKHGNDSARADRPGKRLGQAEHDQLVRFYNGLAA